MRACFLLPSQASHGYHRVRGQIFAAVHIQRLNKLLAMLPVFPQSLSPSPYFDSRLFHYDERCISPAEKIRQFTGNHKAEGRMDADATININVNDNINVKKQAIPTGLVRQGPR